MALFVFVAFGLALVPGLVVIPGLVGRAASALAQPPPQAARDAARKSQSGADEIIRLYDTIYLTGDRKLEGTILTEGDLDSLASVEVRSTSGSVVLTLRRGDIVRVVRRRSASDVYAVKAARVKAEHDLAARAMAEAELADWCRTRLVILEGAAPNPDAALRHYLTAVELDPTIHRVYPWILGILSGQGPLETADESRLETELLVFELAARGGYENPELDFRKGLILAARLNEPGRALDHLEKVIQSEYGNRGHLRRARSIVARTYVDQGDLEKARAVYERLVREPPAEPTSFEAFFELGRLAMAEDTAESRSSARDYFTKAQALQPEYWPLLGYLAALDFARGDQTAATRNLQKYLGHEPGAFEAAADLALVQALSGQTVASEKRLRELLLDGTERERARAHLLIGKILDDRRDLPGAISEYRKAFELHGDSAAIRIHLGSALLRFKQPEEARRVLDSLLADHGGSRLVFIACSRLLADADLAVGREREARIHLQRASGLDPDDVLLRERLGILLMRQGKHDEAFRHLEKVRRASAGRPATLAALGYYHYRRQEFTTARVRFDAVLGLTRGSSGSTDDPHHGELRAYASRGRSLIDELRKLEVWRADLSGDDAPRVDGWEEVERFGVEISRRDGLLVLSGTQRGEAEGETMAKLERSVDSRTFERVLVRARVHEGRVRLALRLEGESKRGATTGLRLYRDYDGLLGIMVKGSRSNWETVKPGQGDESVRNATRSSQLFFPGTVRWPDDSADHTLEIRKAQGRGTANSGFDLFLDGRPVAKNVSVPGLSGRLFRVGISTKTDREGNSYTVSVDQLHLYRQARK